MLKWFRNILSKWHTVNDGNATDTHTMPVVTKLDTMLELLRTLREREKNYSVPERQRLKIVSQVDSFGPLIKEMRVLADLVTSTNPRRKYYENYPEWIQAEARVYCLDEWLVDEHLVYQDITVLVGELECLLQRILLNLGDDYNVNYMDYYIDKPKRVYQIINETLERLVDIH